MIVHAARLIVVVLIRFWRGMLSVLRETLGQIGLRPSKQPEHHSDVKFSLDLLKRQGGDCLVCGNMCVMGGASYRACVDELCQAHPPRVPS